jgi:hypothetical protein
LLSDLRLRKAIADLTAIERECFQRRQRFAFIVHLGAVLEFYSLLRRNKCAKRSAGRISELFGIRTQKRTHPIRVIIDVSSAADQKSRSRWTRGLRYCWRERETWTDIQEFLRENHGPAGAAAKWSALRSRTSPDSVGIVGKNRVPKVPLFAKVELLKPGEMFERDGRVFRQPDVMETVASSAAFKRVRARPE